MKARRVAAGVYRTRQATGRGTHRARSWGLVTLLLDVAGLMLPCVLLAAVCTLPWVWSWSIARGA